jgi:hypothetical protein
LISSCFACFGAPYLQWRWCRGGWNKNKEKNLIFMKTAICLGRRSEKR